MLENTSLFMFLDHTLVDMKKHLLIAPIILGFAATGVTESNLGESLKASEEKEKS